MKIIPCTCTTRAQHKFCCTNCNEKEIEELLELFEGWKHIVQHYNPERLNTMPEIYINAFLNDHNARQKYFNENDIERILLFWEGWKVETAQICSERLNFDLQIVINIFLEEKKNKNF